jgi:hypothetical protein
MVYCPSACAASYSFPRATRRPCGVAAWESWLIQVLRQRVRRSVIGAGSGG